MTFDECRTIVTRIRREQGTRCPLVRIDYGGTAFRGRLVRNDADPENRERVRPPYGLLVLEEISADRRPEMMLQIADLVTGAIHDGKE